MHKILLATAATILFSVAAAAQTAPQIYQGVPRDIGSGGGGSNEGCVSMNDPLARARCLSVVQPPLGLAQAPGAPVTATPGLPPHNVAECNQFGDSDRRAECLRNLSPAARR